MRRTVAAVAIAWSVGFCMASAVAYGYAMLDAWRGYGDAFQVGYVVGYLDAVVLHKRHDPRLSVPTDLKPNYDRWRALVNDYYTDPVHAHRSVPDAMAAAGKILLDERVKRWNEQHDVAPTNAASSPTATPEATR